jgi:hypothetical protein
MIGAVGCGDSGGKSTIPPSTHVRVTRITLTADSGFPAPATAHVSVTNVNGKLFVRLTKLVPKPLPAPLTAKVNGVTACVPVILTINTGNGHKHSNVYKYRACQRPASFRPLLRAMCPLLHRPDFCTRYKRDLSPPA